MVVLRSGSLCYWRLHKQPAKKSKEPLLFIYLIYTTQKEYILGNYVRIITIANEFDIFTDD